MAEITVSVFSGPSAADPEVEAVFVELRLPTIRLGTVLIPAITRHELANEGEARAFVRGLCASATINRNDVMFSTDHAAWVDQAMEREVEPKRREAVVASDAEEIKS